MLVFSCFSFRLMFCHQSGLWYIIVSSINVIMCSIMIYCIIASGTKSWFGTFLIRTTLSKQIWAFIGMGRDKWVLCQLYTNRWLPIRVDILLLVLICDGYCSHSYLCFSSVGCLFASGAMVVFVVLVFWFGVGALSSLWVPVNHAFSVFVIIKFA